MEFQYVEWRRLLKTQRRSCMYLELYLLNEREDGSLRYGVLGEIVCGVVGSELRDYFLLDSTIVSFFYICIRRHLTIISCLVCSSLMHIIVARNTWREFLVDITYRYNKIQ